MPETMSPGVLKLLREPALCYVATLMPDGSPQIIQVWVDADGEHVPINTAEGRPKTRNVRRDPRVAVNVVDPADAWRLASIRGRVVEITTEGANDLVDQLAQEDLGVEGYPFRNPDETRVTLKAAPERVTGIGLEQVA